MARPLFILSFLTLLFFLAACGDERGYTASPTASQSGSTPSYAQGDTITVTGALFNVICSQQADAAPDCDVEKSMEGFAVGVRAEQNGDAVWILYGQPTMIFADYMKQTVRIQGQVLSKGVLIPQRVELKSVDDWITIL